MTDDLIPLWPPYPSVILGRGRWVRVLKTLSKGTAQDRAIASIIQRQIDRDAERINRNRVALAGRGVPAQDTTTR